MSQEWRRKRQRRLRGHKLGHGWPRMNVARFLTASLLLSLGLLVIGGTGRASAASTRAEYIAQVDPICRSWAGTLGRATTAYNHSLKRLNRVAKSGTFRAFVRQDKHTADALNHLGSMHTSATNQIEAVQPVPEDAGVILAWITDRRRAENYIWSAAGALRRGRFARFSQQIARANEAVATSLHDIAEFGFQVCHMRG